MRRGGCHSTPRPAAPRSPISSFSNGCLAMACRGVVFSEFPLLGVCSAPGTVGRHLLEALAKSPANSPEMFLLHLSRPCPPGTDAVVFTLFPVSLAFSFHVSIPFPLPLPRAASPAHCLLPYRSLSICLACSSAQASCSEF